MPRDTVTIGLHCSHEQLPPSVLLEHAQLAAAAGFTAGMCSDHFQPWSARQGASGFAWSWLGAALQGTPAMSFGTVCAPGQRYHPAVIAQAAATLAEMYPDRFWLAIGSGEALNESITGEPWPQKRTRQARVQACAEIMRALWAGETVSTRGLVATTNAHLYTRPARSPLLLGAALTPQTAAWVGTWADGLITVAGPRDGMQAVVNAFRDGGGEGKPMFLQVTLSFAPTAHDALSAAHTQWRHSALNTETLGDLSSPAEFDRACAGCRPDDLRDRVRVSAEIADHLNWIQQDVALGFERVYLHNVARDHQPAFIEACGTHLVPSLAPHSAAVASGS
jgi:coenzyme F420-dependent glucose-6-phosphate dehydrogenase